MSDATDITTEPEGVSVNNANVIRYGDIVFRRHVHPFDEHWEVELGNHILALIPRLEADTDYLDIELELRPPWTREEIHAAYLRVDKLYPHE